MRGGARPTRAELHFRLVGLGVNDELREIAGRQVLAGDQHEAHVGDQRDRREVGGGVVERPARERLIERVGAHRPQHEHVAVGRRLRHPQRAGHAARAGHVVHDHLLADHLAEILRQDTAEHVDRAAGSKRNHHRNRARRPILGPRIGRNCQRRRHCQRRARCARRAHLLLLNVLIDRAPSYHIGDRIAGGKRSPVEP
jgi:hypothetical protein